MATSKFSITEGSGINIPTNTISEDAVTKHLQRVVVNDSSGVEQTALGITTGAKVITDANGTLQQYLRGLVYLDITAGAKAAQPATDGGPSWTSSYGVSSAAVVSADMTTAAAVTDAPTGGQKIVVDDIVVSTDTAMNILFECETSGVDIFKVFLPANGSAQITPRGKVKLATADKKLTAKASVAGNVAVTVTYHSEA